MSSRPLVSIIIPCYNMEEFVAQTIESALRVCYPNKEIVIVDDGSKDSSCDICRFYADNNQEIRFFEQPNSGVAKARNRAISESKGKYIFPLDADDIIDANIIDIEVDILERNNHVKVVTSSDIFIGDKEGPWELPQFNLNLLARRNLMSVSSLYRKEDWVRIGGYQSGVSFEDWVFWIAMLKDGGEVVRVPQVGIHYRIRGNSRRVQDRNNKKKTVDFLNAKYPDFFNRELDGKLHYNRTFSRLLNKLKISIL